MAAIVPFELIGEIALARPVIHAGVIDKRGVSIAVPAVPDEKVAQSREARRSVGISMNDQQFIGHMSPFREPEIRTMRMARRRTSAACLRVECSPGRTVQSDKAAGRAD